MGIRGKILNVIKDLYTSNADSVRIGNFTSESFNIESGVMQGSKLGPILFIIFINDLLKELHGSNLGVSIYDLVVSALGYADDIMLLADTPAKLQKLIDISYAWSVRNGMEFNIDKCKVMILNSAKKDLDFRLSGIKLEFVDEYKYLGIMLSRKRLTNLIGHHVARAVEKARTRVNCIRHFGFRNDGLRPVTCISMYTTLVRPILEYGVQALSYKSYSFKKSGKIKSIKEPLSYLQRLEKFQNWVLKTLIPCPKSTPPALVRLLAGIPPLNGRADMLKLRFYWTSTAMNISSRCDKLSTYHNFKTETQALFGVEHWVHTRNF